MAGKGESVLHNQVDQSSLNAAFTQLAASETLNMLLWCYCNFCAGTWCLGSCKSNTVNIKMLLSSTCFAFYLNVQTAHEHYSEFNFEFLGLLVQLSAFTIEPNVLF